MSLTPETITAAYEQERLKRRPPVTRDDLPFVLEDMTTEWLTLLLCSHEPKARVTSYRLDAPDDGTSNRRRIFLDYNAYGTQACLPKSVFCKGSQGLANRISMGIPGGLQTEVHFYKLVRPALNIESPKCYFATYNSSLNSLIILKDLRDEVTFCQHTTKWTREHAEKQMRTLARLHGRFLSSAEKSLSVFSTWGEFFGRFNYPALIEACDVGFGMAEEFIPPRLFGRRKEIWAATMESVERHKNLEATLMHGDCHLRNWYLTDRGEPGLTDWQGVARGHWSRDFAFALVTSLSIEDRRKWEEELLACYLDQLSDTAGRSISSNGAFDEIRRQLLTILAYWTMTINSPPGMPEMQPREVSVEFLRRICTAMDDWSSLDSFR